MAETAPNPLEWHPAYRNHTWLLEWLEGRMPPLGDFVRVPKPPTLRLFSEEPADLLRPMAMESFNLTRSQAYGLAPYVGEPFVYVWQVGTDQLGRSVAGEAHIQYKRR